MVIFQQWIWQPWFVARRKYTLDCIPFCPETIVALILYRMPPWWIHPVYIRDTSGNISSHNAWYRGRCVFFNVFRAIDSFMLFCWRDDVIKNGRLKLTKSNGTRFTQLGYGPRWLVLSRTWHQEHPHAWISRCSHNKWFCVVSLMFALACFILWLRVEYNNLHL